MVVPRYIFLSNCLRLNLVWACNFRAFQFVFFSRLLWFKTNLNGIFCIKHSPMPIFLKIARHV
jgi:hypothetical protein